ncbi:MAG: hypothetical protein ABIH35_03810 [Patescibacteria group bacterium]
MASPIETLNRRRQELAKKLEFLENDPDSKQLKEKLKIEARLSRLDGKIETVRKSRQASAELLQEINKEIEALEAQIETPEFVQKFAVSEKIIMHLLENPKAKLENLKPADFTENPALQEVTAWKNILEDAKKGLPYAQVLTAKEFDWKNPKDSIDKIMKKGTKVGKEIIDQIQKHPYIAAGCLIAGAYALYQFFKKDSKLWDKAKGAIAGGIAIWLGLSAAGSNMPQKIAERGARALFGDDLVDKFFGIKKDVSEKTKNAAETVKAGAEKTLEGLGKRAPETVKSIKKLWKDFEIDNVSGSKENLAELLKNIKAEGGQAVLEITKDGSFKLLFLGLKGAKEAYCFSYKITQKMVHRLGEMLADPDKPWWTDPATIIKIDSYIAGVGGAYGFTKALFTTDIEFKHPLKTIRRVVGNTTVETFKGATWGQVKAGHRIFQTIHYRKEIMNFYKSQIKLGKITVTENLGKRQVRWFAEHLTDRANRHSHEYQKGIYHARRAAFWDQMSNEVWMSKGESEHFSDKAKTEAREARRYMQRLDKRFEHASESEIIKEGAKINEDMKKTPKPKPAKAANPKPQKPKTGSSPEPNANVIDLEKIKRQKVGLGPGPELRTTEQKVPELAPMAKPHLRVVEKPKPAPEILSEAEIRQYADWCEQKGVKPIAKKILRERLATFGTEALKLGATPLMIFLTIHNIESAPPSQRNEAIAENGAALTAFYIALKAGSATFKAAPGPFLHKTVGAISIAMLSFFIGEKGVEKISNAILKKLNLDFSEGGIVDNVLLSSEIIFGFGGLFGLLKNKLHTGENAREFLERNMPSISLSKGISRFRYNSVNGWNKRIQKKIFASRLGVEKNFLKTLLINEDWRKIEAAKLADLEFRKELAKGKTKEQLEQAIAEHKKFLGGIGQFNKKDFSNKEFIQAGVLRLLEQQTLALERKKRKKTTARRSR